MTITFQTIQKYIVASIVCAAVFSFYAPYASATTYYYNPSSQSGAQIEALVRQINALIAQLQAQQQSVYTPYHTSGYTYQVIRPKNGSAKYLYNYDFDDDDDDNDDDSDEDVPEATTDDAEDVEETTVELHGDVDMNDYNNGTAFFVYGEDEDAIEDVADESEYDDVDQDGDDLRKVFLSSNVDDDRSFSARISGLDDDTDHFFRICVEYDDEDDDETLVCGDVEEFTTDEN